MRKHAQIFGTSIYHHFPWKGRHLRGSYLIAQLLFQTHPLKHYNTPSLISSHLCVPPVLLNGLLWTFFLTQNPPLFDLTSFLKSWSNVFAQEIP